MNARCFRIAASLIACISVGCSQTESPSSSPASQEEANATAEDFPQPVADQTEVSAVDKEPAPPTAQELARQIRELYAAGKFEEAEAQFSHARGQFPDSTQMEQLHAVAAAYLRRSDRLPEAFTHVQALTDMYMDGNFDRRGYADLFGRRLGELAQLADMIEGAPDGEDILVDYRSRAEDVAEAKPVLTDIVTMQQAIYLSGKGQHDEARQLVEPLLTKAREQLESSPGDIEAILGVANALEVVQHVESAAKDGGDVDASRAAILDFLFEQAKAHPKLEFIRQRFLGDHLTAARSLAYTDPEAAAEILDRINTFQEDALLPLDDDELTSIWWGEISVGNLLANVKKSIDESRQRFALIGTPAIFPEKADGWVGTDMPISAEQLRGKVVLLDFFAVWCGPCIATFPHLRAWHDEFADDGLQIVGVSEYHSYDWDAEAGRAKRVSDLEPEAERAAMELFAAHHGLVHPIAYTNDDNLKQHYVVKGIPHVVLIDRAGKVRMHRIGSGERNAADLERAIKECLAETAPLATQSG